MTHFGPPIAALSLAIGVALAATNVYADAAQTIVDQCNTQSLLDMPEKCECMGNKARMDLSEQQQELAAARLTDDAAAAGSLEATMSSDDAAAVAPWLENVQATCEQGEQP